MIVVPSWISSLLASLAKLCNEKKGEGEGGNRTFSMGA